MTTRRKAPKVTDDSSHGEVVLAPEQHRISRVDTGSQYLPMLNQAITSNLDIDRLERFMALQKDWEEDIARKQFVEAMSWFQSDIPIITKKGHADFGEGKANYDYAKLEDIAEGIKPYLAKNGLSYSWECSQADGGYITVTCTMYHVGGHSKSSTMTSTPDSSGGKAGIHQIASARSYLKRYTLIDVGGITVGGEDDDAQAYAEVEKGSAAEQRTPDPYPDERFTERLEQFSNKITKEGWTAERIITFMAEKGISFSDEQIGILEAIENTSKVNEG